ncbi:MAG: hypothetical protein RSO15_02360 [Bacteroides sp.]|uniref:hypothetical protein n=1 Tax=Bacteroides sp. TaxID=29523 RepID=UPI002FCB7853
MKRDDPTGYLSDSCPLPHSGFSGMCNAAGGEQAIPAPIQNAKCQNDTNGKRLLT